MPNCTTSTNPSPSECIFGGVSGSCSISGSWFLWQRDPLGECNIRFARKILSHCDHAVLGFNMKRERERERERAPHLHNVMESSPTYSYICHTFKQFSNITNHIRASPSSPSPLRACSKSRLSSASSAAAWPFQASQDPRDRGLLLIVPVEGCHGVSMKTTPIRVPW